MPVMKKLIDELIRQKANGNSFQAMNIQMKLLFKGVPALKITDETPDDDMMINHIYEVAKDFNVNLPEMSSLQ